MIDVTIVEKILCSLMPKYDYVVCSIKESKDIDELLLDELQSSLLVYEQKMNRISSSEEQSLKASTNTRVSNFRGRDRGIGRGDRGYRDGGNTDDNRNFRANDDHGKGRRRNFDKSKVECYRCHKFGHYKSECYTRLPNDKDEKSNFAKSNEIEILLMTFQGEKKPEKKCLVFGYGLRQYMC